jgi:hypothetical protein
MLAQGPFTVRHLAALLEEGVLQPDTLVVHAAHGPSLLHTVLAMPHAQQPAVSEDGPSHQQPAPITLPSPPAPPAPAAQQQQRRRQQSGASAEFSGRYASAPLYFPLFWDMH